jgi:putative membrane protein
MKKLATAFLTLAAMFAAQFTSAQTNSPQPDTATVNFISQASTGSYKEIATGRLAQKKAQSGQVKAFGTRMIADHSLSNNLLMRIVKAKGYQVPAPPSADAVKDPMLDNASGAAFDKAYAAMMVVDHQKTIALFQHAANSVPDAKVKAFAKAQLPVLKKHLTLIQQINDKVNGAK